MLLGLVGAFMLAPFVVSLIYGEHDQLPLLVSALITMGAGTALWYGTRNQPGPVVRKESYLVVALAWLLASAFGSLPYLLAGTFSSPLDAYFEAMGGFTTTGASVLSDIEGQPHGILFWRGLTQWLGGIGIIAFFLSALPIAKMGAVGASALYEDEVTGPQVDRFAPRLKSMLGTLWLIYMGFTVALVLLLLLNGLPLIEAITLTFGTVASGGYAPRDASVAHYDSAAIDSIVIVFMAISGVNFGLHYAVLKGNAIRLLRDVELRLYLGIMATLSLLVAADLLISGRYSSPLEALRFSAFQAVSLQTGTGFATADYDAWPWFSKTLLLLGMFIGASVGSTCGGLKVLRLVVLAKYAQRQLSVMLSPRSVAPIKVADRPLSDNVVRESVSFFVLFQAVFLFSILALTAMGIDLVTAVSGTAATVAIVGPGMGQVGPALNYALMPDLAKVIFIFNMYVGRLDLWAVLIVLRPVYWREA
jgi:trk system potassium uptake protein